MVHLLYNTTTVVQDTGLRIRIHISKKVGFGSALDIQIQNPLKFSFIIILMWISLGRIFFFEGWVMVSWSHDGRIRIPIRFFSRIVSRSHHPCPQQDYDQNYDTTLKNI